MGQLFLSHGWIGKKDHSICGEIIKHTGVCIVAELESVRRSWAGHIARMGTAGKPPHFLKAVLMHRNLAWWRSQQVFNENKQDPKLHRARMGTIRRWEARLPVNWILQKAKEQLPSLT